MDAPTQEKNALREKIRSAPKSPGCYIYRNASGAVIYVGKAKKLSSRVRQYFNKNGLEWKKLNWLVRSISDVEYAVTESELDALLLEHRLIKKHRPFYNAQMKADVEHPFLRVDTHAAYPTISIANNRLIDGTDYFDYFFDKYDAMAAIEALNAAWHTPMCGKASFSGHSRPCMAYSLGKCAGPCAGLVEPEAYRQTIGNVLGFLRGADSTKLDEIQEGMEACSKSLEFEKAAHYRVLLEKLGWIRRKIFCRRYDFSETKRVAMLIRPYKSNEFAIFYIYKGEIAHRSDFSGLYSEPRITLNQPSIDSFIESFADAIQSATTPIDGADWQGCALIDVFADKYYITLPKTADKIVDSALIKEPILTFLRKNG